MTGDTLFEIRRLKKHFPIRKGIFRRTVGYVRAVDGVDLTVERGTTVGLVGESGCGKTTLGRCILSLIKSTNGEIFFDLDGRTESVAALNREQMHRYRKQAQIVFQNPYSSLNPAKTVYETLSEPLKVFGMKTREQRERRMVELLQSVNLRPEYLSRYPHQFSGGQRQRIALARSLTVDPIFLLCDEPVSALDVSVQTQVLNLLRAIQKDFNLTMVFIAHDLKVVEYMSDSIAVMYLGKIVERFPADDLAKIAHPYTRALVAAIPLADPKTRGQERVLLRGEVPDPSDPPPGCRFHPRCPLRHAMIRGEAGGEASRCAEVEPEWREVSPGHHAACHWIEVGAAREAG